MPDTHLGKASGAGVFLAGDQQGEMCIRDRYGNSLKFLPQGNPVFTYQFKRSNVVEKNSEDLLLQAEQMIKDMQRCLL